MHIPDGMLSTSVALVADVGVAGLLTYAVAWTKQHLSERKIVLMAVLGALIFALQMLNFPVAGGTSGHFLGAALAAITVGFWPAVIVMAAVLGVQCLVFSDGGLLAYGANLLNMGIAAALAGWLVYRLVCWLAARGKGDAATPRSARIAGAAAGAFCGTVAAAGLTSFEIIASGNAKAAVILPAMLSVHVLIGIGEAVITGGIVAYLAAVRPDLLWRKQRAAQAMERSGAGQRAGRRTPQGAPGIASSGNAAVLDERAADSHGAGASTRTLRPVYLVLAGLAVLAAGFSWAASKYPDGLEHVYFSQKIGNTAAVEAAPSLLGKGTVFANYGIRGLKSPVASVIAGLVGLALVALLLWLLFAPKQRGAEVSARGKLVAGVALILVVVLLPGFDLAAFLVLLLILNLCALLLRAPLAKVWRSAAVVLLFAGMIAALAPLSSLGSFSWSAAAQAYRVGWPRVAEIVSKAFLSAFIMSMINRSSTPTQIIEGLAGLRLPSIFLMLTSFIYRFSSVFRAELVALQQALASRAPNLRGWRRVRLYGSLGGNLFVRAYERGEAVHGAMLSRGYSGRLPDGRPQRWTQRETMLLAGSLGVSLVLIIYRGAGMIR